MKCPKCGRLWDVSNKITSSTYVCPYCGDTMDSRGQSKGDLGEVIYDIISKYGDEIIDDTARLNALLMDYAPNMAKERKLVINALKEGMISQLRRFIDVEKDTIESASKRCSSLLVSEMWITERAAQYAINVILQAVWGEMPIILPLTDDNTAEVENAKQLIKGSSSFGAIVREEDLSDYNSIGYKAFASNQEIREIYVPANIKYIYPKAFKGCGRLKKVHLTGGTEKIGNGAFDGCVGLEVIELSDSSSYYTVSNDSLIGKKTKSLVKHFGDSAQYSVTNGITSVARRTFERNKITGIRIPESVADIEEDVFYLTLKLEKIDVESNNKTYRSVDGVLHTRDGKVLLKYPQGKTDVSYYMEDGVTKIEKKAFSCVLHLTSITFDSDLKEIGDNAFEYCEAIENIMLPRSVQIIGQRAFQYCNQLSSVMLPQGIVRIGDCAFMGCFMLKTISVPRSVKEIGNMAFSDCRALSKIVIQENVMFIGDKAFDGCPDVEISVKGNEYVSTYCKMHGIKYTTM